MFLGSLRGAQSSAMIYSLIPRRYVEYLMKQLAAINQYDDTAMEQLMPWSEEVQKFSKSENV